MSKTEQPSFNRPLSIAAIGAGNRMRTYMHYVKNNPQIVKLSAICEPNDIRRTTMAEQLQVPANHCFADYHDFFNSEIAVDAVIICTPENIHLEPSLLAIKKGYHILIEKPIARTYGECVQIANAARSEGIKVGVCYVMRYFPCYIKIKEIIDSGELGQIISIDHSVDIGIDRDTHSYVRGIMNRAESNNPLLLAKCCHDVDMLLWLTGKHVRRVSSFGSLLWFRKENAPAGSAERCVDCDVEGNCPYSAVDLYWRRRDWISNFDIPKGKTIEDALKEELYNGRYGRCVYHCDNDVADNQKLLMEMEDKSTINMSLDVFTTHDHRTTKIQLSGGEITCDEHRVIVETFKDHHREIFDFSKAMEKPFHGGADINLFRDFIRSVSHSSAPLLIPIDDSLESHKVCIEGERSRLSHTTITL